MPHHGKRRDSARLSLPEPDAATPALLSMRAPAAMVAGMMIDLRSPVAVVLLLPACASLSPESRLQSGLTEAGLSPRMAACMAPKMADRLSLLQLRRLQSLGSIRKSHSSGLAVDELLHKLRALQDPEIISVTSGAAISCAF